MCTQEKKIKIAVIDSGIDIKAFTGIDIKCINECTDTIGHGTAVMSILAKAAPYAEFYCMKLFDNGGETSTDDLIEALLLITSMCQFDIIHLSCGVVSGENIHTLYSVCKSITDSGTVIVSAFNNEGAISYPAAFDNVIGVDWNPYVRNTKEYKYVKNSPVNIYGVGSLQRLPWKEGTYKYVSGSSFAAPYITGIVADLLHKGNNSKDIFALLKKSASQVINLDNSMFIPANQDIKIKKAIIYPFNKEIHTLSSFEDMLKFELKGIYDSPLFRNVGKKACEVTGYGKNERIIMSQNDIDWKSDFDTVILGHVDIISTALNKNIVIDIINNCIKYKKNLYAFDDLRPYHELTDKIIENGNFVFFPKTDITDVDKSTLNKKYILHTPVFGVFGTSPKQGKFSLQLSIKKKLEEIGYKTGALGTEPTALLFGFDKVYAMGYGSVCLSGGDAVLTINRYMHEIEKNGYDIIMTGSQSQTIPYNTSALGQYPLAQHDFYLGTEPDAIVLCVNPYDEPDYIRRTILYLENYITSKVVALAVFPKSSDRTWVIMDSTSQVMDLDMLNERKQYFQNVFNIPCFISGEESETEKLVDCIIDYFAEESSC